MPNLKLYINDDIIKVFKKEKISLDFLGSALIILNALYDKDIQLLDKLDDSNKERRIMMLYIHLMRKGFIEEEENEDQLYKLTEKGLDLVLSARSVKKEVEPQIQFDIVNNFLEKVEPEVVQTTVETTGDVSQWVEDWINLFPSEKINGRYLRTNKVECAERMKWFMKNYNFEKDLIIQATKNYLYAQETSPSGHAYTRNASYFIYKGRSKQERTSDLASWCQRVVDNNEQNAPSDDPFNKLV